MPPSWRVGSLSPARSLTSLNLIQQNIEGDAAYEGANNGDDDNALPRAVPRIYNATLIGASN